MIFRNSNGKLVEINKYDYSDDMIYYEKIMSIYKEYSKHPKNNSKKDSKEAVLKNIFNNNSDVPTRNSENINKICKFINVDYNG